MFTTCVDIYFVMDPRIGDPSMLRLIRKTTSLVRIFLTLDLIIEEKAVRRYNSGRIELNAMWEQLTFILHGIVDISEGSPCH